MKFKKYYIVIFKELNEEISKVIKEFENEWLKNNNF